MDSEHKFSFHMEPRAGGGYVATFENPPNPPLKFEGNTREEVQQQVRARIGEILGPALAARLPQALFEAITHQGELKNLAFKETVRVGSPIVTTQRTAVAAKLSATSQSTMVNVSPAMTPSLAPVTEEDLGPIQRTGDGTNWMMLVKFLVGAIILVLVLLLLRRQ